MSDIRYDPLADDYVIVAPERLHRPDCTLESSLSEPLPEHCPFCEGHEAMTPPEIFALREGSAPNGPGWKTRVVPNLYKAVQIEAPWANHDRGPYDLWEGFGAHEVIIDTPRHIGRMDQWTAEEYFDWLLTFRSRLADLRGDLRLVYFALFKNQGRCAGATQSHPHSQLIALPNIPRAVQGRMERALEHYRRHGHSLFQAILEYEKEQKERIVARSQRFVALCPYASREAFEVAIYSNEEGRSSLADLDEDRLRELGGLLRQVLGALYRELGALDFNLSFNTPPQQHNEWTRDYFDEIPRIWRLGLRIVPRLFSYGGFEVESGMRINPVPPEEAAQLLRTEKLL
ncbi:galactose-1-phosphate uridylyltransferase [Nitratifractor sp.]